MTAQELINKLGKIKDKEVQVLVDGYEGGLESLNIVKSVSVVMNYNTAASYFGPHELSEDTRYGCRELHDELTHVNALLFTREQEKS